MSILGFAPKKSLINGIWTINPENASDFYDGVNGFITTHPKERAINIIATSKELTYRHHTIRRVEVPTNEPIKEDFILSFGQFLRVGEGVCFADYEKGTKYAFKLKSIK